MSLSDPVTYSVRRRHLDRDLQAVRGLMAGRVLEIGWGRLARRGRFQPPADGVRWVSIDRDPARAPHICADAAQLPVPASTFDTVLCLEVLEYIWQPGAVLAEIRRVLAPGGTLILSTPLLHRTDTNTDYWRFTEPALRRLLREAGFDVVQCVAQGHALGVAASILRYSVSVERPWIRRVLSVVLRPVFGALLRADAASARRHAELSTFTTGYLVVARPAPEPT